jgi:hypothetical protein
MTGFRHTDGITVHIEWMNGVIRDIEAAAAAVKDGILMVHYIDSTSGKPVWRTRHFPVSNIKFWE